MSLFDVVEVQMDEPRRVRVIAEAQTEKNADATVNMAVMRRGVETSFFATVPTGRYRDGDIYAAE